MADEMNQSLRMLNTALEKEERGREFYKEAASKCVNDLGKEMFRSLMVEETVHVKRVKQIFDSIQKGEGWSKEWKRLKTESSDLEKLFQDRIVKLGPQVESDSGDIEALNIGIEMEQSAVTFYENQLDKSDDRVEREFVSCMIDEERAHYNALVSLKLYFEDPVSWFSEKESPTLDGA
jgi:rubrerythrin